MSKDLAIILPVFKGKYLQRTMDSILKQTNKEFTVYVGDDNSPENIHEIIEPYMKQLSIKYKKFDINFGKHNLTKQWERSINLSINEPYIWLFSDDDIMPIDAVERFYNHLSKHKNHDLFRFNLEFIDENDHSLQQYSNHPKFEKSLDFIKRRLLFQTLSAGCEYIFTRTIFIEKKGFVEFDLAWCSDDATWALFGEKQGILTISGESVKMRLSAGNNISTDSSKNSRKFKSVLRFTIWLKEHFRNEIPTDLYYNYLISQVNYLKPGILALSLNLPIISKNIGFIRAIGLLLNRPIIYKQINKLNYQ